MERKVLVFSHHFYPSREVGARRSSELAIRMRDAGWSVTVICALERDGIAELERGLDGIEVIRIPVPRKIYQTLISGRRRKPQVAVAGSGNAAATPSPGQESVRERLKRYYHSLEWLMDDRKLWSLAAFLRAALLREKWAWVISSGPPMSVHVAAKWLSVLKRCRWAMDFRDPWVESGHWKPSVQTPLRKALERKFESGAVRGADVITATSPGIAAGLARRFPAMAHKMHVVYNGFDGDVEVNGSGETGHLRLLYAGSLYYNRNPFPLLDALGDLLKEPGVERSRVIFTFVGPSRTWNGTDIGAYAAERGFGDCVRLLPPVSPAEVRTMIRNSEVLVNFAQGQPSQIPAKFYEHLAAGREMLLITEKDSDSARLAFTTGLGRVVEPGDDAGLREVLRELYAYYVRQARVFEPPIERIVEYSRERQNRRFLSLLWPDGVDA